MILKTVHIKNFKSIRDSNEFRIDEKVTCLVGKNEAGKTAILQALTKLNPVDPAEAEFDELEYPRHQLNEYQESGETAVALITKWELDTQDVNTLEALIGPTAHNIKTVEVSKDYDNETYFNFEFDESAVVRYLIERQELKADERESLMQVKDVKELRAALSELSDPTQRQKALSETINSTFAEESAEQKITNVLSERLPKIAYFSEYLRMPGQVP
jgi:predicted ATP-binding protein involved in virulence